MAECGPPTPPQRTGWPGGFCMVTRVTGSLSCTAYPLVPSTSASSPDPKSERRERAPQRVRLRQASLSCVAASCLPSCTWRDPSGTAPCLPS